MLQYYPFSELSIKYIETVQVPIVYKYKVIIVMAYATCAYHILFTKNDFWQFFKWAIPEKTPNRGHEDILFLKNPGIIRFFILPLEIPDKTKLHP